MLEWCTRTQQHFVVVVAVLSAVLGWATAMLGVYAPLWIALIVPALMAFATLHLIAALTRAYVKRQLSFRDAKIYMEGIFRRDVQ